MRAIPAVRAGVNQYSGIILPFFPLHVNRFYGKIFVTEFFPMFCKARFFNDVRSEADGRKEGAGPVPGAAGPEKRPVPVRGERAGKGHQFPLRKNHYTAGFRPWLRPRRPAGGPALAPRSPPPAPHAPGAAGGGYCLRPAHHRRGKYRGLPERARRRGLPVPPP